MTSSIATSSIATSSIAASNKVYLVHQWIVWDEDASCNFIAVYKSRDEAKAYIVSLLTAEHAKIVETSIKAVAIYQAELQTVKLQRETSTSKTEKYALGIKINDLKDQLQRCEHGAIAGLPDAIKDVNTSDSGDSEAGQTASQTAISYGRYGVPDACRNSVYVSACCGGYYCIEELEFLD